MGGLEDRMKMYEDLEAGQRFMPLVPIVARIDGRAFHTFTQNMHEPFDDDFRDLMAYVTKNMVQETNARIGYTQSDEISLVFYSDEFRSQLFFDGRVHKMISILASMATVYFNTAMSDLVQYAELRRRTGGKVAQFDCRVWQVPNKTEAANTILWREQDAIRNSTLAAAQYHFGHKNIQEKKTPELRQMLRDDDHPWEEVPEHHRYGIYFQRHTTIRAFTIDEIEKLPSKHDARINPDLQVERSDIRELKLSPFARIVNRIGVIFQGEEPQEENGSDAIRKNNR